MEDFGNKMARKPFALAVLMLLLFMLLSGAAAEEKEDKDPATPTDLDCLHVHVRITNYFFDSPLYTSVSTVAHRVAGPATVETVCLDCGELLSSETVGYATEYRPHIMKKGVCALCGYRSRISSPENQPEDYPGERTILVPESGKPEDLLTLTLFGTDFTALELGGFSTALVRGENSSVAIALNVPVLRYQLEENSTNLYLEFAEREDGSFFADVYLLSDPVTRIGPEEESVTVRFYQEKRENVRVSFVPVETDVLEEVESVWDEKGYWNVPYPAEGTYFLLQ